MSDEMKSRASSTRRYEQKLRAEQQDQTREKIAIAAMELHGTLGPAQTTIKSVAERAGVQRATVYRHFRDEAALFEACSSHWNQLHPPPDPEAWAAEPDPAVRTKRALDELYAYYAETEEMMTNLIRDESLHPAVPPLMANYWNYISGIASLLLSGRGLRGRRKSRTAAAIRLAVDFRSWQLLVQESRLAVDEAASVMSAAVEEAALSEK